MDSNGIIQKEHSPLPAIWIDCIGIRKMKLDDIKNYRGYMPVRMEREDTVKWIGSLVGNGWLDKLWLSKYSGYHEVRYRFGNIQEAQIYMKDKSWNGMPIDIWLRFSELDRSLLDENCWKWIFDQRRESGITEKKTKAKNGGLLDI
jgi:hypothetical protein